MNSASQDYLAVVKEKLHPENPPQESQQPQPRDLKGICDGMDVETAPLRKGKTAKGMQVSQTGLCELGIRVAKRFQPSNFLTP